MKSIANHLILLSLLLLVIFVVFWQLPNGFFEQDEWHTFGYIISLGPFSSMEFWRQAFPANIIGHFTPLAMLLKLVIFQIFALNALIFFIVSISFHIIISILLYLLIFNLLKDKLASFLGAIFFAVNSSHHQAVTWIGTFDGTEGAVFLGILSLLFLFIYKNNRRLKYLFFLSLSILTAFLFKETALSFLIILIIAIFWIYKREFDKKIFLFPGVALLFYLSLRLLNLLLQSTNTSSIMKQNQSINILTIIFNFFISPFLIMAQIVFPQQLLIKITDAFGIYLHQIFREPLALWVKPITIYILITFLLSLIILFLIIKLAKLVKNKKEIYLGLFFIFLTFPPLILINKKLIYIDSRYLYVSTIGMSIIIAVIIKNIQLKFFSISIKYSTNLLNKLLICVFLFTVCLLHVVILKTTIDTLAEDGSIRKMILTSIIKTYPKLPQKTIFYIESDTSYYGLPENEKILPFQSGFGQTLLVWYYSIEDFPIDFYKEDFLWNIYSQGYKEVGKRGFGYFRDFNIMKKNIDDYNLSPNSIIAFSWNHNTRALENITNKIRIQLRNEL